MSNMIVVEYINSLWKHMYSFPCLNSEL